MSAKFTIKHKIIEADNFYRGRDEFCHYYATDKS